MCKLRQAIVYSVMADRTFLLAASAMVCAHSSLSAAERVPIIGNDGPDKDACGGIGRIFTMDETLSVYEEPDQYSRKKDGLPASTLVWLCEAADEWQGIVYPTGEFQDLGGCRVSTPVTAPRAYEGPCEHGWVMASNLNLTTQ